MKFRKLLAGAAVAALTAGSASALDLTLADNGAGGTTTIGLALEGNNIAAADTVVQSVRIDTDAPIAAANNYVVTLTLSGGTFGRNVTGADLGTAGSAVTFNGTNVQFDGADRTGEEGDTVVRFLGSASTSGSNFFINVPIKTDCSAPVTMTLRLQTEAGTDIEEGTVALATSTLPTAVPRSSIACVEAYSATIARDDTNPANDSVVTVASTFRQFDINKTAPAAAGGAADTVTVGTLGTITYTYDPTGATAAGGAVAGGLIWANLGDVAPGPAGNLPVLPVADAEFTLTTSSRTGIASLDTGAFTSATDVNVNIDKAAAGNAATATTNVDTIVAGLVPLAGGNPSVNQPTTVTASAATLNYTNAGQGLTDEPIVLASNGVLDLINYEAGVCGTFDWVGDANTSRRNVWRVTGAPRSVGFGVFASMTNSSNGVAAGTAQITPAIATANEIIITDSELTTAFGNFGRADFSFSFAGDLSGFDCDRLQSSPAASIVTPFGNGTANDGNPAGGEDGDD